VKNTPPNKRGGGKYVGCVLSRKKKEKEGKGYRFANKEEASSIPAVVRKEGNIIPSGRKRKEVGKG